MTGHGQPIKSTSQTPQIRVPNPHFSDHRYRHKLLPFSQSHLYWSPKKPDGRKPVPASLNEKERYVVPPFTHTQNQRLWEHITCVRTHFDLPFDPRITDVTVTNCIISTKRSNVAYIKSNQKSKKRTLVLDQPRPPTQPGTETIA
jgi:hypothetical protein